MDRSKRIFITALWALLVLTMTGIILTGVMARRFAANAEPANAPLPLIAPVPAFHLIDQNAKPLDSASLLGHPYIVDLIFTRCGGVCPMMTAKMASLGLQIAPAVHFVSVSVDPKNDTPAEFKKYAQQFHADESRWSFLTGDLDQITVLARGLLLVYEPATASEPITHSDRFLLIDSNGQIRGVYRSNESEELKRLVTDANTLAAK